MSGRILLRQRATVRWPVALLVVALGAPHAGAFELLLPPAPIPYLLGGQATAVWQWKPAFHSPYQGAHSLQPQTEDAISQT